jgi:hypothetical protein
MLHVMTSTRQWLAAGLALAAVLGTDGARAASHPVAIEVVKPGREGLELTARLTEASGVITQDIAWTIRTAAGETVYGGEAGSVDISLAPGDYVVEAAFGAAAETRSVSLPPGARLMVSFILEAEGFASTRRSMLRIFPPRVLCSASSRWAAAGWWRLATPLAPSSACPKGTTASRAGRRPEMPQPSPTSR